MCKGREKEDVDGTFSHAGPVVAAPMGRAGGSLEPLACGAPYLCPSDPCARAQRDHSRSCRERKSYKPSWKHLPATLRVGLSAALGIWLRVQWRALAPAMPPAAFAEMAE
jgi:hypothetical protein